MCPIDIPLFIRQISSGDLKGSAQTIFSANILGGICARVCPTETLCEQAEKQPVRIGLLQRYATDALMEGGDHPFTRAADSGKSVVVIGGGMTAIDIAVQTAKLGAETVTLGHLEKPVSLAFRGTLRDLWSATLPQISSAAASPGHLPYSGR